jgi:hypothetical protein
MMSVAGCGSDDVGPQRGPVVLPSPDAGTHGDASTSAPPPPPPAGVFDWRDAVIYFTFVDRFFDGDGQNPCRVNDDRVADLANYKGGDRARPDRARPCLHDRPASSRRSDERARRRR